MSQRAVRYSVYKRDRWKCRYCKIRNNLHAHHIIYRSHQGPDEPWNMITLCNDCHEPGVHAGNLEILPAVEGQRVDANGPVIFKPKEGWKPR